MPDDLLATTSLPTPLREVAVARTKGLGLDFEAELEEVRLAEVQTGERSVFARAQPSEGDDHLLLELFTSAKGGSVVLWRRGPRTELHVLRRSKVVGMHVWEPSGDDLRPVQVDAATIVEVLGLAPESVVPLEALMRRENAPLDELCRLLQLPPEALRVISGECGVEDLPGAIVHEPEDDEDAPDRRFGWRDLILHGVCVFVFGSGVLRWIDGGSTFLGLLGAAGLILTIKAVVNDVSAMRRADDPD